MTVSKNFRTFNLKTLLGLVTILSIVFAFAVRLYCRPQQIEFLYVGRHLGGPDEDLPHIVAGLDERFRKSPLALERLPEYVAPKRKIDHGENSQKEGVPKKTVEGLVSYRGKSATGVPYTLSLYLIVTPYRSRHIGGPMQRDLVVEARAFYEQIWESRFNTNWLIEEPELLSIQVKMDRILEECIEGWKHARFEEQLRKKDEAEALEQRN